MYHAQDGWTMMRRAVQETVNMVDANARATITCIDVTSGLYEVRIELGPRRAVLQWPSFAGMYTLLTRVEHVTRMLVASATQTEHQKQVARSRYAPTERLYQPW